MRRTQGQSHPITWLNLLCLDAPLVAIAWQQLFARSRAIPVSSAARISLFATAWLIYLVDRVADSSTLASTAPVSLRQQFARRNRMFFIIAIAATAAADAVAIPHLDRNALRAGVIVGVVLLIYLAVNRFVSFLWSVFPVKELAVGVLFAAGVFASLGANSIAPLKLAGAFAALCALNCMSIAYWERDLDIAQNRSSIATAFPALKAAPGIACAVLALIALLLSWRLPFVCIAASAALLAIANLPRVAVARDTRTAIADLVLLTPIVALPFAS